MVRCRTSQEPSAADAFAVQVPSHLTYLTYLTYPARLTRLGAYVVRGWDVYRHHACRQKIVCSASSAPLRGWSAGQQRDIEAHRPCRLHRLHCYGIYGDRGDHGGRPEQVRIT
jgi:hypothetical protein